MEKVSDGTSPMSLHYPLSRGEIIGIPDTRYTDENICQKARRYWDVGVCPQRVEIFRAVCGRL